MIGELHYYNSQLPQALSDEHHLGPDTSILAVCLKGRSVFIYHGWYFNHSKGMWGSLVDFHSDSFFQFSFKFLVSKDVLFHILQLTIGEITLEL